MSGELAYFQPLILLTLFQHIFQGSTQWDQNLAFVNKSKPCWGKERKRGEKNGFISFVIEQVDFCINKKTTNNEFITKNKKTSKEKQMDGSPSFNSKTLIKP